MSNFIELKLRELPESDTGGVFFASPENMII
jgi:hypothetical protein